MESRRRECEEDRMRLKLCGSRGVEEKERESEIEGGEKGEGG